MSESWSEEELSATVRVYLEMYAKEQSGENLNKKASYRDLALEFGRSEKAYEYRMQNISYIFALLGRQWVSGLKPAKNVGRRVGEQIESLIARHENRQSDPTVGFEIEVSSYQQKASFTKPQGVSDPRITYVSSVSYDRSAQVKAWVLNRARGFCELCKTEAPFTTVTGNPYLEVHHVKHLSLGGTDTVSNCVALCPNCHRALHYSSESIKLIEKLYKINSELMRE
ncbi:TPA: HNH endonuclease signature motif containing protein [Vibrio vulnificus]|uniref:HNH endonuclease n=1 Tax=Vibrio vulnificus TaxID=672 RepID=UPI001A31FD66|nr:HNH endonuclease signature motif containing protein [Vibrio vulnificus]ELM6650436.1 HNH endonuclease [Vibrio vulnificus]ELV8591996.1 HNH endonuclease [Vibrio vulnificus]HAS6213218.1 HNH endonuclease [Vibrio vulnificus]HAS6295462.1 HNH endonuclease [Vibrio vulnificus]HAS6304599.1 HNH endonuclease [Vibrio vulnificus]